MEQNQKAEKLFQSFHVKEAYPIFQKMAEAENGRAMYFMALYLTLPLGVVKADMKGAEAYLEKGSRLGDPLCAYENGLLRVHKGEKADMKSLLEPVLALAEKGDVFALDEAPECYFEGLGVEKNDEKALSLLQKASDAGYWLASSDLGDEYFQKRHIAQDFQKAADSYEKAASMGFVYAQDQMAFLCYRGTGVPKDQKKAIALWRKCASMGYAPSANALGFVFSFGPDKERREKEAFRYFQQAAEEGFPLGYGNLANCYYYGRGTKKDRRLARIWYKKAADAGLNTSMMQLGVMMQEDGKYDKAYALFRKAAENGNADAMGWLAACYTHGWGTKKDDGMALLWLRKAAESGSRDAEKAIERYFPGVAR